MPRPRTYRTPAIILKRRDIGEADRLVTLLTPFHGKVDAVAKGARRPASTRSGHVELFTRADVLIAKGRDLDILTQAELVQPYLGLHEDLTRGAYANYVVELMDRFTYDGDIDSEPLFKLLDATLARLCDDDDVRRVVRYYEIQLLEHVGFRPELHECVVTREPILPMDQFFSYSEGGVVSPEGANQGTSSVPLSLHMLKLLRHMQRSAYKQVATLRITEGLHGDAERLMVSYIRYILEARVQSVDFIQHLRRLES
jgi:DNA repair protein RecO (recombination protein O)